MRHPTRKAVAARRAVVARNAVAGFTLIELLTVVLLLGILAAIVIPQFTNASADAKASALASIVQTVRSQIGIYKIQHGDQLPDLVAASAAGTHFRPLVTKTPHGTPPQDFGPYLLEVPVNPLTGGSTVLELSGVNGEGLPNPVPGADFIYDYAGGNGTGMIWGTTSRLTGTPLVQ